jgi:hypothetical protein
VSGQLNALAALPLGKGILISIGCKMGGSQGQNISYEEEKTLALTGNRTLILQSSNP